MKNYKKIILSIVAATMFSVASAQILPEVGPSRGWAAGLNVGLATPMSQAAFWGSMRPSVGAEFKKYISRSFSLGLEGSWYINTSTWRRAIHSSTAFDASYVGAYGSVDLVSLLTPSLCSSKRIGIELMAGAGWGHYYRSGRALDHNFFATKTGLNLSYRLSSNFSLQLRPSFVWDMSDATAAQSSASYSKKYSAFNLQAGFLYHFGSPICCVQPYDQKQVDDLNSQINGLRLSLDEAEAELARQKKVYAELTNEVQKAREAKPEIVREVSVNNRLNTECDVFFNIGSSAISSSQMPNVERIASYMRSHPQARVVIRGYASRDGNPEYNRKLAQKRAEAVKNTLINKYKIAASRIQAQGQGIGDMFEEESWNRVSICTLEN